MCNLGGVTCIAPTFITSACTNMLGLLGKHHYNLVSIMVVINVIGAGNPYGISLMYGFKLLFFFPTIY